MIPIKRVDHISMGHADWKAQSAWLERVLGFKFLHSWPAGKSDFEGCVSQVPGIAMEFEIISPAGPESFVQKFLDAGGGPGLHHITIEVEDIKAVAAEIEALGMKPFGGIQDDGMWHLTYVHPKDSGGTLWQLFQPYRYPEDADRTTSGGLAGLKRVDHVSMAVADVERQVAWQERVFGMEVLERWTDEHDGYHGAVMRIPNSQLQFEIIAPARPDSFVQAFLNKRRAGMHHICCEVASVDAAVEALRGAGIEPHGGVIVNDWKKHTIIHPRDSGGVLFQLFEE
ncbi:MAG: VOC family protein [Dehalococcoidia bacterium]